MNDEAPERIWIQRSGLSFFQINSNGTYYKTPDVDSIGYVRDQSSVEILCACRTFKIDPVARAYLDGCNFVHTTIECFDKPLASPTGDR